MWEQKNADTNELDILGRDDFVCICSLLIDTIFETTKSSFIMIDGQWGVGKTFVMNMLDKKLRVDYNIIKYNCWENSYYNDPLEAILSVMLDYIDKGSLWSNTDKEKFKELGMIALNLLSLGSVEILNKAVEKAGEYVGKDKNSIYAVIQEVKDYINSNKEMIIILVDEIDRCLPEYGVKTLERLYLLFKDAPNIVIVINNDKSKMEMSIQNIFGYKSIDNYLEKFIDYTLKLDVCKEFERKELFDQKYAYYLDNFELHGDYWELCNILFSGKDARHINRVMNKAYKIHTLCFGDYVPMKRRIVLLDYKIADPKTADHILMAELLIIELKELSLAVAVENYAYVTEKYSALSKYIDNLKSNFKLTYERSISANSEYKCFWYLARLAKEVRDNLDLGYFIIKLNYNKEYMANLYTFYKLSLIIE